MTFSDYVIVLRRRWKWLAASMAGGVLVALGVTLLATPTYKATAQVFVAPGEVSSTGELAQGSNFTQNRVKSYVQVIDSDLVLGPIADQFGIGAAGLAGKVTATVPTDTALIDISVTDSSPERAAALATAIAKSFPEIATEIEPAREDGSPAIVVTVVQEAPVPGTPITPRLVTNLALGLFAGTVLGLLLMVVRELTDTRLKSERDVVAVTVAPVLGRIPPDDRDDDRAEADPLAVLADPHGQAAEAYRALRTTLQAATEEHGRTVLITSSIPGEGKTCTATNLALVLAAAGSRVCLVDGDLRLPGVDRYTGLDGSVGVTTVLAGAADLDSALQPWGPNVHVLTTGELPPNPSELLGSPAMDELLDELTNRFDVVIVDGAPLLPVTDSAVLARRVGSVVVVVGIGDVKRRELRRSLGDLETIDAPVVGVVLVKTPITGPNSSGLTTLYYRVLGKVTRRAVPTTSVAATPPAETGRPAGRAQSGDPGLLTASGRNTDS